MTRSAPVGISAYSVIILAWRRPLSGFIVGDRRPHAPVELAAKLLDEPLLVLAHPRVALGEQDLAVTGLHAKELDHR